GTEHGHHVLGSQPDGATPGKPFVGCDRLTGSRSHLTPAEHRRHLDPPCGEGNRTPRSGDPHHTPGRPDFGGGTPYAAPRRRAAWRHEQPLAWAREHPGGAPRGP